MIINFFKIIINFIKVNVNLFYSYLQKMNLDFKRKYIYIQNFKYISFYNSKFKKVYNSIKNFNYNFIYIYINNNIITCFILVIIFLGINIFFLSTIYTFTMSQLGIFKCIFICFLVIFIIFFIDSKYNNIIALLSIYCSFIIFILTIVLLVTYKSVYIFHQFIYIFEISSLYNIYYTISLDILSLLLINLTTFFVFLCLIYNYKNLKFNFKSNIILLLLLEFFLINFFLVNDLFFFYIFFESTLIPMFLIIGVWGSRKRKIHANYQFFIFTLLGSIFMLYCIMYLYSITGSTQISYLSNIEFSFSLQKLLWPLFFISFWIKIPIFPLHIWLPEAHVEAPTTGSVILAAILLKLGFYGIIKILFPLFPQATVFYIPYVYTLAILSIIYCSLSILLQTDLKKIIAYSSIIHMNFGLIGLFSNTFESIIGSILLLLTHGLISGGLFFIVGMVYDRFHTRNLKDLGGLNQIMPFFSLFFILFNLSNMGFPGTSSFISETFILFGCLKLNLFLTIVINLNMFFGACYSVWLIERVCYGVFNPNNLSNIKLYGFDLSNKELYILFLIMSINLLVGFFPNFILDLLSNYYIWLKF
jgi:NADH-quinone oxidoreductase subunit M